MKRDISQYKFKDFEPTMTFYIYKKKESRFYTFFYVTDRAERADLKCPVRELPIIYRCYVSAAK